MTVQLTSVNPKYSNIFNFVKKSDLVKGGSATFRNEGGPSFNLSIFQPLVSPSAKLSSLIFIHQKGQTYRFDRLKFIQIYANWKSKEWNVQEHKNNVGHHFAICAVLALLQRKVQPSGEKTWKNLCYKRKYHKGLLPISYLCSRTFDRGKKCLILSQQDGLKVQNLKRVLAFPQQVKWSKACFF